MNILRYLLLGLVLLALAGNPASARDILLLNEPCGGSTAYFPTALNRLGFDFSETNDMGSFYDELTGGTLWDLVIIDDYSSRLTPEAAADGVLHRRRRQGLHELLGLGQELLRSGQRIIPHLGPLDHQIAVGRLDRQLHIPRWHLAPP